MIEQQWSVAEIERWLKQIECGEAAFDEGKAWQLVKKQSLEQEKPSLQATLLAHLAFSRYERFARIDPLGERWIDEALMLDGEHPLAHQLRMEQTLIASIEAYMPKEFPPIRETDHGTAKKKTAEYYFQMAERFFSK